MGVNDTTASDLDSLIVPIYALTSPAQHGTAAAGWMGYRPVAHADDRRRGDDDDDDRKSRTAFLFEIDISPKTLDAMLHIVIIFLVLFIIVNCMCKFVWLFLK